MNDHTPFTELGGFHSWMAESLTGSILTCPSLTIMPKYSTSALLKKHFSSFRNNLCFHRHSNTFLIHSMWSSWLLKWMRMSSMSTISHPSAIRSPKMWFINAWKVARELHRPKNITVDSNSPRGVTNTAFHLSSGLMRTLLYPHWISILVKINDPLSLSIRLEISSSG